MPQRLFVAHSRTDRSTVGELIRAARSLGYAVALDDRLPGGSAWWSEVLERVARAEVFVYAVSGASLDSEVCRAQHTYAGGLGIPALPVVVGEGVADSLVPPDLARLQRVDYRDASKSAMAEFYRSIESLPVPVRRDVQPPPLPRGFELDATESLAAAYLDPSTQQAIVAQLENLVAAGVTPGLLADVVAALRARNDLTVRADEQLAALVGTASAAAPDETTLTSDPLDADASATAVPGATRVFISYSRSDVDSVGPLAQDLRQAGFEVWLDRELPGGMEWWDEILLRIREGDAFLVAASDASRASRACASELEYARALGKPVLHVAVEAATPQHVGSSDAVARYVEGTAAELARIISTLRTAHITTLPTPLPVAPAIPASYLFDTRTEIRARRVLKPDEQMALIDQLRRHLAGDIPPLDIVRLSGELREREDLTVEAARALDAVRQEAADAAGPGSAGAPEPSIEGVDAEPMDSASESRVEEGDPVTAPNGAEPDDVSHEASPPDPTPVTAGVAAARPTRRRGRKVLTFAAVAVVAVAGTGVVRSLIADTNNDDRDSRVTTTQAASLPTQPTTPLSAAEPAEIFAGITGTTTFSWEAQGVTYAATLTTWGSGGIVDVAYINALGVFSVIQQDLILQDTDGGWAYVGSNPRLSATGASAVTYYSPDTFYLTQQDSVWFIDQVCSPVGGCATTG